MSKMTRENFKFALWLLPASNSSFFIFFKHSSASLTPFLLQSWTLDSGVYPKLHIHYDSEMRPTKAKSFTQRNVRKKKNRTSLKLEIRKKFFSVYRGLPWTELNCLRFLDSNFIHRKKIKCFIPVCLTVSPRARISLSPCHFIRGGRMKAKKCWKAVAFSSLRRTRFSLHGTPSNNKTSKRWDVELGREKRRGEEKNRITNGGTMMLMMMMLKNVGLGTESRIN